MKRISVYLSPANVGDIYDALDAIERTINAKHVNGKRSRKKIARRPKPPESS